MVKVFAFLTRRKGIETQAFIDHYENQHVPLVLSLAPAPLIYKRNYVVRGDEFNREDDAIDFDVVTELVFSDRIRSVDREARGRRGRRRRAQVPRTLADEGLRHRRAQ
jgi:hypothetical protein